MSVSETQKMIIELDNMLKILKKDEESKEKIYKK